MKHPFIVYNMADELSGCHKVAIQIVRDMVPSHQMVDFETSYWARLVGIKKMSNGRYQPELSV
jgi:hypothetical protein